MNSKIKVGDEILVMRELLTKVTKIDDEFYYFLDTDGTEWKETIDAIEKVEIVSEKIKTQVILSELTKEQWKRFAGYIDNGYFPLEEKHFEVYRMKMSSCYRLCSLSGGDDLLGIKVYCEINSNHIEKIEVLGIDNEEFWIEVHQKTYNNVEKFLNELI